MVRDFMTMEESNPGAERRDGGRRDVCMRIVFDDRVNMNMAAAINLSDDGLLMTAGVEVPRGTPVTIFPIEDEIDARLFELKGEVVRCYEDILVSAYADDRFRMGIRLDLSDEQREALRKFIAQKSN